MILFAIDARQIRHKRHITVGQRHIFVTKQRSAIGTFGRFDKSILAFLLPVGRGKHERHWRGAAQQRTLIIDHCDLLQVAQIALHIKFEGFGQNLVGVSLPRTGRTLALPEGFEPFVFVPDLKCDVCVARPTLKQEFEQVQAVRHQYVIERCLSGIYLVFCHPKRRIE